MSIKNAERERRKEKQASVIRLKVDRDSTKTPKQFKKFLSVGKSRENLIEFSLTIGQRLLIPVFFKRLSYTLHMYASVINSRHQGPT